MKTLRYIAIALAAISFASDACAQQQSTSAAVSRRSAADRHKKESTTPGITERMQAHLDPDASSITDADLQWMRVIYRNLDLTAEQNAPLYYPEEPIEGQENLFRIIMRLLADGQIPAYEYLDGREIFTDKYRVPVKDILDRFYIIYQPAKGSTEKRPRYTIDEADVPSGEVLSYFIIERWTFDTRHNRLRPEIEAIAPVLHRAGDFGGDAIKYPMFWLRYDDLRPYLTQQNVIISDHNNLPACTYDDYFTLGKYQGEIYKTRNLRNKSMAQLYPDPDDLKHARDSIQGHLDNFEAKLWTPTREELQARAEAREALAAGADTTAVEKPRTTRPSRSTRATARSKKKPAKIKESSASKSSSATRSVRRRKK